MQLEKEYHWRIDKIVKETVDVRSHYLRPIGERPSFIAGQYLTIKLPGILPSEGKAYSIASAPQEDDFRITVKTMGNFSSALNRLEVGAEVTTSAPYGFFYPEPADPTPLVLIVGGIGITPCISIIKDMVSKSDPRPILLLYSNQSEESIVFATELEELASQHPPLSVVHYITRSQPIKPGHMAGRISAVRIIEQASTYANPEFFLCGSIKFVRDLYRGLISEQIPVERIYTEGFY